MTDRCFQRTVAATVEVKPAFARDGVRWSGERFLLPLFLLKPVRCGECFRRDYKMVFTPVRDRMPDPPKMVPAKPPATSTRNVA